jgi:hypothetical protein
VPNFGHSEVLIKITEKKPLLLTPRDKFVTLNIFVRKFFVDFPTREDWSTECVDLAALDGLVFFTDGSLCKGRAGADVFSDILNVRETYALGSHATVFQSEVYAILACSEYCISEGIVTRVVSICSDSKAALLALKSYAMSSRVVLQCRDFLQELVLSYRVRHCPLNKHLQNMGLIDEPICIAFGMKDESAFHLLCNCPSLISLKMRLFLKPIVSVEEYEGASASALLRFALASGRFTVTP